MENETRDEPKVRTHSHNSDRSITKRNHDGEDTAPEPELTEMQDGLINIQTVISIKQRHSVKNDDSSSMAEDDEQLSPSLLLETAPRTILSRANSKRAKVKKLMKRGIKDSQKGSSIVGNTDRTRTVIEIDSSKKNESVVLEQAMQHEDNSEEKSLLNDGSFELIHRGEVDVGHHHDKNNSMSSIYDTERINKERSPYPILQ